MSALTRSKGADPPFFSLHWAIVIHRFNVKEFDKVYITILRNTLGIALTAHKSSWVDSGRGRKISFLNCLLKLLKAHAVLIKYLLTNK